MNEELCEKLEKIAKWIAMSPRNAGILPREDIEKAPEEIRQAISLLQQKGKHRGAIPFFHPDDIKKMK